MGIREIRKKKGLTQKQLADRIGVNIRWVQRLESGEIGLGNITLLNAYKLFRGLTETEEEAAQVMYRTVKRIMLDDERNKRP